MDVKTIAVIGAGTMGRGIAYASALAGFQTVLEDVSDSILAKALDQRLIAFQLRQQRADADFLRCLGHDDPAIAATDGPHQSHGGKVLHDLVQMITRQTTEELRQRLHT